VSFARGASPLLAIEYARRSIPEELRPSFVDLEMAIKRDARIPAVIKPGEPEVQTAETQSA
jgi:chemotaxis protein MotA